MQQQYNNSGGDPLQPANGQGNSLPAGQYPPQQEQHYQQPVQPEPEDEDDDDEGRGGFVIPNPFLPIKWLFALIGTARKALLTGCLIIVLLLVLFFVTVIIRPPFLWNPFKDFLNAGLVPPAVEETEVEQLYDKIGAEGKATLSYTLSEAEAIVLFRQLLSVESDLRIDSEENTMSILLNLDTDENPLWMVARVEDDGSMLSVTKVGFERIGMPGGINSFLSDQLFGILNLTKQQVAGNSATRMFDFLLKSEDLPPTLEIENVYFRDDKIEIVFKSKLLTGF
ncbi:MAG: hypothetical protein ACE5DX_04155 [Candidatus Dojkabacteria bacterium]